MPRAWRRIFDLSSWALRLTTEEAERLREELTEVIDRYRRDTPRRRSGAGGAERVSLITHHPARRWRSRDRRAPYGRSAGVLAAMAVSLTGTRVSAIALPWFVLVTTGSATQTGLVAFCEMTPYVLVKAFTGPLVDRVGPRRISWITDVASAAATAAVSLLHAAGPLAFGPLLALVAVIGAARGPGDLAKEVMVPEAAERGRVPLERATGLAGVTERLASTVGPAAGGALVALLGPLAGLAVNAACFALGSVIIGVALPRGMGQRGARISAGPGIGRRRGRSGPVLAAVRRRASRSCAASRCCSPLIVMVGITNLLDAAFTSVLCRSGPRSRATARPRSA